MQATASMNARTRREGGRILSLCRISSYLGDVRSSRPKIAVLILVVAGVAGAAGFFAAKSSGGPTLEVSHRTRPAAPSEPVKVVGQELPAHVVRRMPVVTARLVEPGLSEPAHGPHELTVRLDPDGPTGTLRFDRRTLTIERATLTVHSHEAPLGDRPTGAWFARVTWRLRFEVDLCEGVAPLKDLFARGWPGPCGYVAGDERPHWWIRREFLIRRERLESDGSITDLFQGRCVPLTALGYACKLEGRAVD